MRIDLQIAAHLRQQVAADFLLPILEGGEFWAEVQAPMATLTFVTHKFAGDLPAPRQPPYAPLGICLQSTARFRAVTVKERQRSLRDNQMLLNPQNG